MNSNQVFLNCTTQIHGFYVAAYSNTSVIHKVVADMLLIHALQEGMSSDIIMAASFLRQPAESQTNPLCVNVLVLFSGHNCATLHYGHSGAPNDKKIADGDMW